MSVITTNPMLCAPSAAGGVSMTSSITPWANSSWYEFIASTAGDTTITALQSMTNTGGGELEIEFGTGTAGNEVPIGVWRYVYGNSGGFPASQHIEPPYPLGGIGTGVRLAARIRYTAGATHNFTFKIGYYTALSSDQQTAANNVYSCVPTGADGASIAANTSAWANSSYVQLTSGLAGSTGWYGLAPTFPSGALGFDGEWDIATGEAGAETVITTIRISNTASGIFGALYVQQLVAVYVIPASTRVAARIRKSGTSAATYQVSGLYITNISASSGGKGDGKGKPGKGNPGVHNADTGGALVVNIGNIGLGWI